MRYELARIDSAKLEIKERGILNFWIFVSYENGLSQGVGGIVLDNYDENLNLRVGTAYGCEVIRQLLLCLNVDDFSEMKGKDIWVIGQGEGLSFKPKGIQALRADGGKEVVFDQIYAFMEGK